MKYRIDVYLVTGGLRCERAKVILNRLHREHPGSFDVEYHEYYTDDKGRERVSQAIDGNRIRDIIPPFVFIARDGEESVYGGQDSINEGLLRKALGLDDHSEGTV